MTVEFRASPIIGANAFALPGGIVIVTDQLMQLAEHDDEILAVLAHEIGHVKHRHVLRGLPQDSATALIIAGVTGDVSSITPLAAAAPTFLMRAPHSREHEAEADRHALQLMQQMGMAPHHFPAILNRMASRGGEESDEGDKLRVPPSCRRIRRPKNAPPCSNRSKRLAAPAWCGMHAFSASA